MALYKFLAISINQIFHEFWLHRGLNNLNAQRKSIVCDLDLKHPAGDVLWVFVEPGNVVP